MSLNGCCPGHRFNYRPAFPAKLHTVFKKSRVNSAAHITVSSYASYSFGEGIIGYYGICEGSSNTFTVSFIHYRNVFLWVLGWGPPSPPPAPLHTHNLFSLN